MMKNMQNTHHKLISLILLLMLFFIPKIANADESDRQINVPEGVHIKLTKEFYESLIEKELRGGYSYSNDPSIEYLKEIAISARFMVETNLKILEQQERILQLLRSLLNNDTK